MTEKPSPLLPRNELTYRQGIKSSLKDMKALIASLFSLYIINEKKSSLDYSQSLNDASNGKTKINLKKDLEKILLNFFSDQFKSSEIDKKKFLDNFNKTPLFTSQIEALQVVLELFWKIGKIQFIEEKTISIERTGGNRYEKRITFSTNIEILDSILTDKENKLDEFAKNLLFNYIAGTKLETNNIENKFIKILTIFSEHTQYKIRDKDKKETEFQQEGIYDQLIKENEVIGEDKIEKVGPFRILNSAITQNLNYFIKKKANNFILKDDISINELNNYREKVNTYLNLMPYNTTIIIEDTKEDTKEKISSPLNKIFYGAPGTGKSHKVNQIIMGNEENTEIVTFHPEFDYVSFVGGYKPSMDGDNIKYEFVPQAFTNIYLEAWKNQDNDYFLVIEEINRGNCAEIFGDIFQLLDRNSNYRVTPSKELKEYLQKNLSGELLEYSKKLLLPPNLNILATMNTSDQALFPMDSAFKRRWDWEYIPINYEISDDNLSSKFFIEINEHETFSWISFISAVNTIIKTNENLGMDKCIGNYFIKPQETHKIGIDTFINKAIFYLWNDVFKDEPEELNIFKDKTSYEDFFPINSNGINKIRELLHNIQVNIENK
ncbi:MAG: McrB family protein [Bacillota bacterium]